MLAPRNKLWSTPLSVIDEAISALEITPEDIVFDIGAGDGRFLMRCARLTGALCTGVEINQDRAQEAIEVMKNQPSNIRIKLMQKIIEDDMSDKCHMICGNALEQDYSSGTVFYLYLVPRGLRIILPILMSINRPIRIITYMAPFPEDIKPIRQIKCTNEAHPDAQWPLYLYHINFPSSSYSPTQLKSNNTKDSIV